MKEFKDLIFKPHIVTKEADKFPYPLNEKYGNAKHAIMNFENGYGVSVIIGKCFLSNGVDTYEVAVLYNGDITYNTEITNDVIGRLSENEVTEVMKQIQLLKE